MEVLRGELTPGIINHLDACLRPPSLDRFRGDLAPIKRLNLHRGRAEELWSDLYRDPELLATLDRILPVAADYTIDDWPSSKYAPPARRGGLLPHHPRSLPRQTGALHAPRQHGQSRPALRVPHQDAARPGSLAGLSSWMSSSTGAARYLQTSASGAMAFATSDWTRHLAACHEIAMHCFSEPRCRTEPLPDGASEAERALLGVRQPPPNPRAGPVLADGNHLRLPPRGGREWVEFWMVKMPCGKSQPCEDGLRRLMGASRGPVFGFR